MENDQASVRERGVVSVSDSDTEIANVLRTSMTDLGVDTAQILVSPVAKSRGAPLDDQFEKKLEQFSCALLEVEAHPDDFEVGAVVDKFRKLNAELVDILAKSTVTLMHAIDTPVADDAGCAFDDTSKSSIERVNPAYSIEVLDADEMLTSAQLGKLLNASRHEIIDKVKSNSVLALQGNTRGFKFPAWQLDAKNRVLKGIKELLECLDGDHWAAYRYLSNFYPDGTGRRGYQVLLQEGADPLIKWISSCERGNFD